MNDILRLNLVGFFTGPMPAQPFGWFKSAIKTPDDIKGLKYRTVGLAANVLQEMGMSVVQLPGGEIQPAMERGLIDAAEFNNPTSDKDFGMQDVSKHYHLASFHQSQESFEIIFNKDKYNALSKEHQAILKYASESASADMSWKYQDRYSNDLIALKKEHGVNVYRTPDSVMAAQPQGLGHNCRAVHLAGSVLQKGRGIAEGPGRSGVGAYELTNAPDYGGAYKHYFGDPV